MLKNILRTIVAMVGITFASAASAGLLDLKIGSAQIFDVQYYWSSSTNDSNCGWGNEGSCDTLNVSGLIAPYQSTGPGGNFQHPNLTSGQYYGFINSPTVPNTYGMAVFNANGTQAYVIHNTGDLYKLSGDGIFYVGGGFYGTVITPSTGYAYGSSATLNVGTGTPNATTIASYTPPSTTVLTAGQTASQVNSGSNTPTTYNITDNGANANFATGSLSPWTAGGGTGTQSTTAYSGTGVGVAVVQEMTSYTASGSPYQWTVRPPTGTYMVSIQPTGNLNSGVNTFDDMATDLGISTASKNEIIAAMVASGNGQPTNAAWIRQDITLTNGQTFHMAWQYISTDYVPFNDGSVTTLVNKTGTIVATVNGESKEYALLGFTNPGTGNYSVGSYGATGWQTAQYTANETGTYRLGFGAFNLSDTALSPILFVTKDAGTTLNFNTSFGPIAPNAGSSAPNNSSSPTVVSTAPGTPIVSSSSVNGTPVVTTVTNTNLVNSTDANGNPVVTTYFTVTTTTTTPTTTTTVTTPVTVTTYSDNSTTTTNGTPVTTSVTTNSSTSSTTNPAIQSVATTEPVTTTSTSSGTATTTTNVITWPSTSLDTVTFTGTKSGNTVSVNKNVVTVVDTPTTTTTTVTTPITTTTTVTPTTTTVDANGNTIGTSTGTPTATDSTINQVVSSDVYADNYSASSTNTVKTANVTGAQDSVNYTNQNLFMVDPAFTPNGTWATPSYSAGSNSNGNIGNSGYAFGYQTQANGNTFGVAGYYGTTSTSGYNNSSSDSKTLSGTTYAVIETGNGKVKVAGGIASTDHTSVTSIPEFGLSNAQKLHQTNVYADVAYYLPIDIGGWTPFAGATVNNSNVEDKGSSGNSLLAQTPDTGSKTKTTPYVGAQYQINDNVAIQAKVSQSPIYGTVVSGKTIVKQKITDNTSMFISAGVDVGSNYNNGTIMAGLTINF